MKSILSPLAILLLAASSAAAQGTAPSAGSAPASASAPASSSAPASAPAALVADLSNPTAATRTLLQALAANDAKVVHDALIIPAADSESVEAMLTVTFAQRRLQDAAAARFGASGRKAFGLDSQEAQLAARLKAVDAATVAVKGDSATLTLAGDAPAQMSADVVKLQKTGAEWKIDAAALLKVSALPADKQAQRMDLAKKLSALTDEIARDIRDGKFSSATDAYQEYWTRAAAFAQPAATAPAGAPATTTSQPG